jgi:hypothetical protein
VAEDYASIHQKLLGCEVFQHDEDTCLARGHGGSCMHLCHNCHYGLCSGVLCDLLESHTCAKCVLAGALWTHNCSLVFEGRGVCCSLTGSSLPSAVHDGAPFRHLRSMLQQCDVVRLLLACRALRLAALVAVQGGLVARSCAVQPRAVFSRAIKSQANTSCDVSVAPAGRVIRENWIDHRFAVVPGDAVSWPCAFVSPGEMSTIHTIQLHRFAPEQPQVSCSNFSPEFITSEVPQCSGRLGCMFHALLPHWAFPACSCCCRPGQTVLVLN